MINKANLKKRLLFAAVAVPVSLFIVSSQFDLAAFVFGLLGSNANNLLPIYPGQVLMLIIVILGTYEYTKMLSIVNKTNAFWLGYLWILATSIAYLVGYHIPATLSNTSLLMIVAFDAFFFGKEVPHGRWKRASLFFSGIIFLSIASISMMSLYREPFQELFNAPALLFFGKLEVVIVLTAIFMCDTAAYFVGSTIGRRKLSSISPNKTVEGSLGGLAASVLIISISWIFIRNPNYPIFVGVIIGLIAGIAAQAGDLLASLMKRYFRVKDASDMIPGHGGVLDRFDSVFFAAPALYLFAWLLTK